MNISIGSLMTLDSASIDRLMPMALVLDPAGEVRHVGPTLRKFLPEHPTGRPLSELFRVRRPASAHTGAKLLAAGGRVTLELKAGGRRLRGLAVPLAEGGVLVNLAFGISVAEVVEEHDLSAADFAPTDLAVELLYVIEARSAVLRESQRLNERLKEAKLEAEAQALSDTLTGLGNRRALDEVMLRLLAANEPFGLMHLDLDYFKAVNDSYGHAAGDHVLCEVAEVLRSATRRGDLVARVGGDEFVLVLRGATADDRLTDLGERLISGIQQPVRWQGRVCKVAASIGATSTEHYRRPDADRMLSDADEALYASKRAGRGTVTLAAKTPS